MFNCVCEGGGGDDTDDEDDLESLCRKLLTTGSISTEIMFCALMMVRSMSSMVFNRSSIASRAALLGALRLSSFAEEDG